MTTTLATNCSTNLTEVHTNINGNATGTEGQNNPDNEPSLACVSESNHTDVENNSLSEGKIEDQIPPADTSLLPEREEKSDETGKVTPIPTYDLSSEDNITNVLRSEVLENNQDPAQTNGQATQE